MPGFPSLARELVGKSALSDAGLTADEHKSAVPLRRVGHGRAQVVELSVPPDKPAAALGWP